MRFKHRETTVTEINLSTADLDEITLHRLYQMVSPGEYLRTKKDGTIWLMQDDPDHRHGSISEEYVRDATELDVAIFAVIKELKKRKQNG